MEKKARGAFLANLKAAKKAKSGWGLGHVTCSVRMAKFSYCPGTNSSLNSSVPVQTVHFLTLG